MRADQDEARDGRPAVAQPKAHLREPLRSIAISLTLPVCIGILLLVVFPNRFNPRRLGEFAGYAVLFLLVVRWLWHTRPGVLVCGCVILVMLASLGITRVRTGLIAFQAAAAGDFIIKGTGGESVLRHPGLAITIRAPGTGYTEEEVPMIDKTCFMWTFRNRPQGNAMTVCAKYCRLATPEALQNACHDFLRNVAKETNANLMVDHEGVAWDCKGHIAEAEGTVKDKFFCVRIVPVESRCPAYSAAFLILALAYERSDAVDMARSLCVTGSELAGGKSNNTANK